MKQRKKVIILLLILILSFSTAVSAGPNSRIKNLSFKNANIVDVLRTVAELADVNLITDSSVSANVTVELKDISFKKALGLITKTRGLDYKWDENTVIVAAPQKLDQIFSKLETKFVKVDSANLDNIATIIKSLFPETQITVDTLRQQLILKGEPEKISEIKEIISQLEANGAVTKQENIEVESKDIEPKEKEIYSESYQVVNAQLAELEKKLRVISSNLNIKSNQLINSLTLSGEKSEVKKIISMAKNYDLSLEPDTRNIRVDYVDTSQITTIVSNFYPDVKLHLNEKRKELIIHGEKNKLNGVEDLISEINRAQNQVMIEVRLEEVSTDKLKELGINLENSSLSRIHFIKDKADPDSDNIDGSTFGQIEGVELTWPDFLRAINNDSDSKTLANPKLMTLNGEEASMAITDQVSYPIVDEDDNTTYDYMEAGINLTFTPWITENKEIELSMVPEISSFGARPEGATKLPPKKTRKVDTKLRLKNGETFAIGGLIQENEQKSMSKIPILGDLPIIGEIFKSRSNDNSRTELLIFVTPRIIEAGSENQNEKLLINSEKAEEVKTKAKGKAKDLETESQNKEEIIAEYLEEKAKNRDQVLKEIKNKNIKEEFNELSPEELEEILNS